MNIPVKIKIDYLWKEEFEKSEWGPINYLIGPNGTGKSIFLEMLIPVLTKNNLKVRYLNSDRLVDWTKSGHYMYGRSDINEGLNLKQTANIKNRSRTHGDAHEAFILLRDNLDIKIKIESIVSQLFKRNIILKEEGGFLNPVVELGEHGFYNFKENESHGLKEIITLLTLLHDNSYNCFIIDEPELHLHPQFQTFLIQEIRKYAGDPTVDSTKKCFFVVTHSPHFIDVRTIDELKNCVVFQPEKIPSFIDNLESDDEYKINQLLPRLNTHHKQFFFSTRPIFVEGNTDQQIFSLIQEKRGKFIGASGSSFIDVNGKDELDLFFRLSKNLKLDCQIIVDLDFLIDGKLRQTISSDERCQKYLNKNGVTPDFYKGLSEVWSRIDSCVDDFKKKFSGVTNPKPEMQQLYNSLVSAGGLEQQRYFFLLGVQICKGHINEIISSKTADIEFISGRVTKIIDGAKEAGVYVLSNGELENYFENIENHFNLNNTKTKSFLIERDYLLKNNPTEEQLKERYGSIIEILDSVTGDTKVDFKSSLQRNIRDFIYTVQTVFIEGEINDKDSVLRNNKINYEKYNSILDILEYEKQDSSFKCKIKLKPFENIDEKIITFGPDDNPTKIVI